jgi:hypothetical protein
MNCIIQDVPGRVVTAEDFPYHRIQPRMRMRESRTRDLLPPEDYTICRHMPHMSRSQERYRIASNQSMQSSGKSSAGLLSSSSVDKSAYFTVTCSVSLVIGRVSS